MAECIASGGTVRFESQVEPGKPLPRDLFGDPLRPDWQACVTQAFADTRVDRSSEFMVCSPPDNERFLNRVRELAPRVEDSQANLALWNARRSGKFLLMDRSRPYSPPAKLRDYEFAVEWAYRHVIRQLVAEGNDKKHTTLERILCVPEWRDRFDAEVRKLMGPKYEQENFKLLDYRWAAMTIRKRAGEAKVEPPTLFDVEVEIAAADTIPASPGVFEIRAAKPVYTGWSKNLKYQIAYMKVASDASLIPRHMLSGDRVQSVAYRIVDGNPTDAHLEALWRGNLKASPLDLNMIDSPG